LAKILEEGPIRRRLREKGFLKGSLSSPQGEIEPWVREVMTRTSLSEHSARVFLSHVGTDPYLFVVYDTRGNILDWDSRSTVEAIRDYAQASFAKRPEARSAKIFLATITLPIIWEITK